MVFYITVSNIWHRLVCLMVTKITDESSGSIFRVIYYLHEFQVSVECTNVNEVENDTHLLQAVFYAASTHIYKKCVP
jgi:hypothetical protein